MGKQNNIRELAQNMVSECECIIIEEMGYENRKVDTEKMAERLTIDKIDGIIEALEEEEKNNPVNMYWVSLKQSIESGAYKQQELFCKSGRCRTKKSN